MNLIQIVARALVLLVVAGVALYEASGSPSFFPRLYGLVPALLTAGVVSGVLERKETLQQYAPVAWVGVFILFSVGLVPGESPPQLFAVLLLGAVMGTSRDVTTGVIVGTLAGGGSIFLASQDGSGSERLYLAMAPLFVLAGGFTGSLVRRAGAAWEEIAALQEELADQREQINNVLACVASGVLVVSDAGRVTTYNRASERILGLPQHTVLGRELRSIPELAALQPILSGDDPAPDVRRDLQFTRPNGQRITIGYAISLLVNRAARRLGLILVFQDVTLIRDYAARMLQQEQLAALGRMVSGIAHEFGNLLGGARGLIELSLAEEPKEAVESLPVVHETLSRALATVENLLRFARGTPLNRVPGVELDAVLERALTLMKADIDRAAVTVETDLAPTPPLLADAIQLEQVFINLIINAIHAVEGRPDARLRIRITPNQDRTEIRFEDTGPGLPSDLEGQVFEPFFTTKGSFGGSETPGTGLGLSIALGVVEGHDGTIEAGASLDLAGACFTISLPSTNGEAAESP